jgi:hypothetical protein
MHVLGLGLHVLIALFFAVHAMRTRQPMTWLFVLFGFPLLGSVVYALAVWLPEARYSRGGVRVQRAVRDLLDPGRELREAEAALERTASAANHLRLADALLSCGQAARAVEHYASARRGVQADDPEVQVRHAEALLEAGQAEAARELLDALIERRPDFRSPRGHLVYARAVAACGDREKARHEFEAVIDGFAGLEARTRYAEALQGWNEPREAAFVAAEALRLAERMPKHSRELNAPWIKRLKQVAA